MTEIINTFRKFNHLEKSGHRAVDGILNGFVFVFPKLDGTNASVWVEEAGSDGGLGYNFKAGSRNRVLSEGADNAGFNAWVKGDDMVAMRLRDFCEANPHLIVYGEWLVKHTIKYQPEAYGQFYIFDIFDRVTGRYIPYNAYGEALVGFGQNVIEPMAVLENPTGEAIDALLLKNRYLTLDDVGEGVVCKNYGWENKSGSQTWMKVVIEGFHGIKGKKTGGSDNEKEKEIAEAFVTKALVEKNIAKAVLEIANDNDISIDDDTAAVVCAEFKGRLIPMVLGRVFYDVIDEELLAIVKRFKMPTINFKALRSECNAHIKAVAPRLFN